MKWCHVCAANFFRFFINTTAYHLGRCRPHLLLLKSSMTVATVIYSLRPPVAQVKLKIANTFALIIYQSFQASLLSRLTELKSSFNHENASVLRPLLQLTAFVSLVDVEVAVGTRHHFRLLMHFQKSSSELMVEILIWTEKHTWLCSHSTEWRILALLQWHRMLLLLMMMCWCCVVVVLTFKLLLVLLLLLKQHRRSVMVLLL